MTSPTLATTFDWGRMYARVRGGTPEVPSITTILDVLDQDLEWWEALCAVRLAMDHAPKLAEVHQMPNGPEKWSRERAAKDWLVAAAERDRNESAERGDFVHNYAEVFGLYSAGMATSADLAEQERLCKQAEVMDYLPHVHRFWETWQPRVLRAEATVWSEQARYAGTTDLIFEIDLDGKTYCVVGDYKTKKALFKRNGEEKADLRLYTSMQLAAVVHAEEMWVEGETPWDDEWVQFPYKIDMGVGIAIGPDGYAVRQYDVHSPLVWDTFTSLRRAWEFRRVNRVAPESLMTKRLAGPHELILPGRPYPTESA